jgi:hypothetical protein
VYGSTGTEFTIPTCSRIAILPMTYSSIQHRAKISSIGARNAQQRIFKGHAKGLCQKCNPLREYVEYAIGFDRGANYMSNKAPPPVPIKHTHHC